MDVKSFIDDWETIRRNVPRANLSLELSPGRQMVAEIATMSRQKETWEVFVCLIGFCEAASQDPNRVLEDVQAGVFPGAGPAEGIAKEFVEYSSEFWTVGRQRFLSAAVNVRHILADHLILSRSSTLDILQECRALHGSDWEKVWKCVRENAGGANAAAGASAAGA